MVIWYKKCLMLSHATEKGKKARSLFSFSAFHFIDDGFTDSIYLLLPFIAAELNLSFSQVGSVERSLLRIDESPSGSAQSRG